MATTEAQITVYWLENSRSQRIAWLLEELKVPYELKMFKRRKDMQADPQLKQIHPLGKSPVVTIQTPAMSKPLVLAESGAIVEYLIDSFGRDDTIQRCERFAPGCTPSVGAESESWLREHHYMHYVEGSLMPLHVVEAILSSIRNAPVPFFIKPVTRMISSKVQEAYLAPNLKTHMKFLEDQIKTSPGGGQFLCGDKLTGPDFLIVYPLEVEEQTGLLNEKDYPNLTAYLHRLKDREGYKQAALKVSSKGWSSAALPRL